MTRRDVKAAVDSSVLVGLLNPRDLWRSQALALHDALIASRVELFYFDCVTAEAISVAARRLQEKGRSAEVETLIGELHARVPVSTITWILPEVPRLVSGGARPHPLFGRDAQL